MVKRKRTFFSEKNSEMSRKVVADNEIIRSTVPPREVLHITRVHTFSRPTNCEMECQMDLFSGRDLC
jgi:hypothetical protein